PTRAAPWRRRESRRGRRPSRRTRGPSTAHSPKRRRLSSIQSTWAKKRERGADEPSEPPLEVVVGQQHAALGLGEATPDPVRLPHAQREVEAVVTNVALRADVFRVRLARLAIVAPFRRGRREEICR